jgi:hypothetical protein
VLFVAWLLVHLTSCATPQKKLHKLLTKYPELKTTEKIIVRDTIRDTLRIEVPGVKTDFEVPCDSTLRDTVFIDTNQLHLKLWFEDGKIKGSAACDTVYKIVPVEYPVEIPVEVDKIIYRRPRDGLIRNIVSFIVGSILTYFVLTYRRKPIDPIE